MVTKQQRQRGSVLLSCVAILAMALACMDPTATQDSGRVDTAVDTAVADVVCTPDAGIACVCANGTASVQRCNTAGNGYGSCDCSNACGVLGTPCNRTEDCCPVNGNPTVCAALPGAGQVCAVRCSAHNQCSSNCCAALANGTGACTVARWCSTPGSCSASPGQYCQSDFDCCPDHGNGYPSACVSTLDTGPQCSTLCVDNSGCLSSCCRARSDGLKVCRPTYECQ